MATINGKAWVSAADLADEARDINTAAVNGIGKKEGMVVFAGAAGSIIMYMATGSAKDSPWNVCSVVTDAITPS